MDNTYYAVPVAERNGAGFLDVFAASILSHFGAPLKQEIAKVVLSAATPPDTRAAMLAAAETVEAKLSKKMTPGASPLVWSKVQPLTQELLPIRQIPAS